MMVIRIIGVAFFTLFERKILGGGQVRKGPDKVTVIGIIQPLGDVLKLFSKFLTFPFKVEFLYFLVFPVFNVFLMLVFWGVYPFSLIVARRELLFGLLISVSSLVGLAVIFSGWGSSSRFSCLGGIRAVIQFLSYEVAFSFAWLFLFIASFSFF